MAMRKSVMKLPGLCICARSNLTGGLIYKQLPRHHHQLKLHGIQRLSGWFGNSSSEPGSSQELAAPSLKIEVSNRNLQQELAAPSIKIEFIRNRLQPEVAAPSVKIEFTSKPELATPSLKIEFISNRLQQELAAPSDHIDVFHQLVASSIIGYAVGSLMFQIPFNL